MIHIEGMKKMYKIACKKELNSAVTYMEIEAPFVAKKAKAGQFIIFRVDDKSERVPLTIAGYDREKGTVAIIFQKVGLSTELLGSLNEGDYIQDFVGPLGKPTDVEGKKRVCVVGGGVGCAIAYPSAKAFKEAGVEVDVIIGFRNKDIVILEDEFKAACDHLYLMTDDGSYGEHGFVTVKLQQLLEAGTQYDEVLAIRSDPDDEVRLQDHRALWREDYRLSQPHHGRRNRHVRRLPRDGWRRSEVCLRRRPRFRRPQGRLCRAHEPQRRVPRA